MRTTSVTGDFSHIEIECLASFHFTLYANVSPSTSTMRSILVPVYDLQKDNSLCTRKVIIFFAYSLIKKFSNNAHRSGRKSNGAKLLIRALRSPVSQKYTFLIFFIPEDFCPL